MTRKTALVAAIVACVVSGRAMPASAQVTSLPGLPGPPAATPAETVRLSVDEAVTRAFEASHRLAEGRARLAGAEASVEVQQSATRPTVTASGGYTRTNHTDDFGFPQPDGTRFIVFPDAPNNFTSRIGFAWPIYTGGRTDALERAAAAEASASGVDIETTRADLRFEVARQYWGLATANEAVRVLTESLARSDAQLQDARNRLAAGLVPPNEVSSFEAQRAQEQLQLIDAQSLRDSVLVDLRRLIGANPSASVELTTPLAEAVAQGDSAANLVEQALGSRPERQASLFRIAAAEAREHAAASGTRPTVAASGGGDFANPNRKLFPIEESWKSSWDLSVNVSWPVFDGGRSKAQVAEASAAVAAARERLADLDLAISADVRQRTLDLASARAAVAASETGVTAATEARRVVGNRFAAGVASNTDVLVAQDALLQAELARARALANVRLAAARLARSVGRP